MRIEVTGTRRARLDAVARRQRGAQGDRRLPAIESLPFARESSELFDRPSINLGRIIGGDALNKVPDRCVMDVDIRYLPGPGPGDDPRADVRAIPDVEVVATFTRVPAIVVAREPVRARARRRALGAVDRRRDA